MNDAQAPDGSAPSLRLRAPQASLALKAQVSVEGDLHGLILVVLPEPEARKPPTILRAFSEQPFERDLDDPAALYSADIGERLMKMVGGPQTAATRWNALVHKHFYELLADEGRYRRYYTAGLVLARAGITSESDALFDVPSEFASGLAEALKTVGALHRDFLERAGCPPLSTPFRWAFERILRRSAVRDIDGAAPRRKIPFAAAPVKGTPAAEIPLGAVVAPEEDRSRKYRVTGIELGGEEGDELVFHLEPVGSDGVPGVLSVRKLERILLAEDDEGGAHDANAPAVEDAGAGPFFWFFLIASAVLVLIALSYVVFP